MELCLGTVQFGLDYGIIGQKKPSLEYALDCLDYATQNGILAIDTATAYGTAESVVGAFLAKRTIARDQLFISTKMLPNTLDSVPENELEKVIKENIEKSLSILRTDYVDAYMLHSSRYAFRQDILAALHKIQEDGLAKKVGVSVYEPEEAIAGLESQKVTILQLPYSVFDHRMKESGVLDSKRGNRCEIHARSAFIQGLITLSEEQVPEFLKRAKPVIRKIDAVCKNTGLSRIELAMAYIKREKRISHLVFGIDSLEQLKEDIQSFNKDVPEDLLIQIEEEFRNIDTDIVMPSLWKK